MVKVSISGLFSIEFFSLFRENSSEPVIIVEPRFGTGVLPQKEQNCCYHRFHVDPSHGTLRNCVPKFSSFNRTETLILNISFNYNYSSSSSPKSNTIYLGIFDPKEPQLPIYYSLLWHIQRFQKPILPNLPLVPTLNVGTRGGMGGSSNL